MPYLSPRKNRKGYYKVVFLISEGATRERNRSVDWSRESERRILRRFGVITGYEEGATCTNERQRSEEIYDEEDGRIVKGREGGDFDGWSTLYWSPFPRLPNPNK